MLQTDFSASQNPQRLQQAEQFVQSTLDGLSAHIAILDETGKIIAVNSAWRRFADQNQLMSQNYCIGTNYLRVCESATGVHSREGTQVARAIRDILAGRIEDFYLEYPCHSKTLKRWFIVHITRFTWDGSTRLIVAHQNITELKLNQLELEESRKRIEAILNNVANGIVSISARGKLESINPAAANIFGYSKDALIGEPLGVLMAEPYRSLPPRRLMETLNEERNRELIGQRRDGSQFPMFIAISEIHHGNRRFYTGIIHDLTERKRMEAEIFEKERLALELEKERELREFKSRFIGLMSHELRTPLSSIMLSSDLLKLYGDRVPLHEKQQYLENINTQVEYLTTLVRDMVAMSNADVNQVNFSPKRADLVALCEQIIDEYRMAYRETHDLRLETCAPRLQAFIDIKLMRQVLNNLIANSIKYSAHGSQVVLSLELDGEIVVIRVSDNGIGIPPEDIPLLFEPFHRARNVQNLPGTGLGLAVVKQSIDLHRGEITVDSQPDVGTVFTIRLPRDEASLGDALQNGAAD